MFYLAGFIEAWGRGYEKIREAFEREKLEVPVFEEVRGGIMATIKHEKFVAIQAKRRLSLNNVRLLLNKERLFNDKGRLLKEDT